MITDLGLDEQFIMKLKAVVEIQQCADFEVNGLTLRCYQDGSVVALRFNDGAAIKKFTTTKDFTDYEDSITTLTLPEGIDKIGALFGYPPYVEAKIIDRVIIPKSCKCIGEHAFAGGNNISEVEWNNVEKIEYKAFISTRVKRKQVPDGVEIDSMAFVGNIFN